MGMRDLMRREGPATIYELEKHFESMLTGAVCLLTNRPVWIENRITLCQEHRYIGEDETLDCEFHKGHVGRHRCTTDYYTMEWD